MEAFDQLAELYQGEHSHNPYQSALIARIDSLVPGGAPVLDLGCGTGVPTAKIFTESGRRSSASTSPRACCGWPASRCRRPSSCAPTCGIYRTTWAGLGR